MTRIRSKAIIPALFMPILLTGRTAPGFQEQSLSVAARFSRPVLADVNRDGFPELFISEAAGSGAGKARISVFFNRGGSFDSTPDRWIPLEDGDGLFDLADADGDGDLDILVMGGRGVFTHAFADTGFHLSRDTVLISPVALPPFFSELPQPWPFASGGVRNGSAVLAVPKPGGVLVFSKMPGLGYQPTDSVAIPRTFSLNTDRDRLSLTTRLPRIQPYGGTGNSSVGGFLITGDEGAFFLPNDSADSSCANAAGREFRIHDSPGADSTDADSRQETQFEFGDFDGNGAPDALVLLSPKPGIFTPPGQIRLYLNRPEGWNAVPDQVVLADCFFGNHVIADFNGDGLEDLCVITLETSVADLARYVLERKIRNRFDIHYAKPGGAFSQKPDRSSVFPRKQTLRDLFRAPLVEQPCAGDFNGDGLGDLALWSSPNELSVIFSRPGKGLDTGHPGRVQARRTGQLVIADLDRDGCSDIILIYPNPGDGVIRILRSVPEVIR
jgi:hypothetical protein